MSIRKPNTMMPILFLIGSCTSGVPAGGVENPNSQDDQARNKKSVNDEILSDQNPLKKEEKQPNINGVHEQWLLSCQDQLYYVENPSDPAPKLKWDSVQKEAIVKLAVRDIFEKAPEWSRSASPRSNDNGTELVNIEVPSHTHLDNTPYNESAYLLADGEIESVVEWSEDEQLHKTPIRSWTGGKEGIRKKLQGNDDAVCLMSFDLKSWGTVKSKDVVVLLEKTFEGDGCYMFREEKWQFLEWTVMSRSPCYTMIMWEEKGEWKSTMRSKKIHPLKEEEICQVLGEEWGIIPRRGPPPPLLKFGEE